MDRTAHTGATMALVVSLLINACAAPPVPATTPVAPRTTTGPSPSAAVASSAPSPTTSPSPQPSAPPAPIADASPSPSHTFPPKALAIAPTTSGWRPVPSQKAVRQEQFGDVVWTGSRFIATGWDSFLDSKDGITWHRQPSASRQWRPAALATGPGGIVAVGSIKGQLTSWHSTDGLTWVVKRDAFPGRATDIADVTAMPAGWLAVGARLANICLGICDPLQGVTWTSPDGLTWRRGPAQASLGRAELTSVTQAGDRYIAGGRKGIDRAAVWSSPDGMRWTRMAGGSAFRSTLGDGDSTTVLDVAARDGRIVAVGIDGGQDAAVARAWWTDGSQPWAAAKVSRAIDGQLFRVTVTPSGFLAVGPSGGVGRGCEGGIWQSKDGQAWRCIANDRAIKGFGPWAAAASATVEIAVGFKDRGEDQDPVGAVWWRPTP